MSSCSEIVALLCRWKNYAAALAKPQPRATFRFQISLHDYFVSVLKKATLLTRRQRDGISSPPRQFEQASPRLAILSRHRATRQKISRSHVAAIARVMGQHLPYCPVHQVERRKAQPHRLN